MKHFGKATVSVGALVAAVEGIIHIMKHFGKALVSVGAGVGRSGEGALVVARRGDHSYDGPE